MNQNVFLMKNIFYILFLFCFNCLSLIGNNSLFPNDTLRISRKKPVEDSLKSFTITKQRLNQLIDSALELNVICTKDIRIFNKFGEMLTSQNRDSIIISKDSLKELCFYTKNIKIETVPVVDTVKNKLSFNGYIDSYFFKNLNNPLSGSNTGKSGYARAFDQKENQFQIGLVQAKMNYKSKSTESLIDLTFGPNADLGNYGNAIGGLGNGKSTSAIAIKQAYFTYFHSSRLSFTAGQFGTHVGYEVIDAPLNFNYSLSNLFNNGPFYHIGIKANYKLSSKYSLMVGVVNDWDNLYDNNKFKTAICQLNYIPNAKLAVYLNYIGGNETTNASFNSNDSTHSFKQAVDLVINYHVTSKLYLGFNGVLGDLSMKNFGESYWGGAALYANYQFFKSMALGCRLDFFDNTQGVMYIGNTDVKSVTVTGNILLKDNIFFKPEFRYDGYKKKYYVGPNDLNIQQFEDSKGYFTNTSQITIGAAFIYAF